MVKGQLHSRKSISPHLVISIPFQKQGKIIPKSREKFIWEGRFNILFRACSQLYLRNEKRVQVLVFLVWRQTSNSGPPGSSCCSMEQQKPKGFVLMLCHEPWSDITFLELHSRIYLKIYGSFWYILECYLHRDASLGSVLEMSLQHWCTAEWTFHLSTWLATQWKQSFI